MTKQALRHILFEEGLLRTAAGFQKGDTVLYKGKPYKVLYYGPTKFGQRARLQFFDGSKDFWVDASLVSPGRGTGYSRPYGGGGSGRCRGCGGPIKDAPHHRAMEGCCGYCAFDEFDM